MSERFIVRQLTQDTPFPAEFRQALGEMILAFSALEGSLHDAIIDLVSDDPIVGSIMTAGLPFSGLVDRYCALLQHLQRDGNLASDVHELRAQLFEISEQRNGLVHSNWMLEPLSAAAHRIRASVRSKAGLRFDTPAVGAEEVLRIATDCAALRARVVRLASVVAEGPVGRA